MSANGEKTDVDAAVGETKGFGRKKPPPRGDRGKPSRDRRQDRFRARKNEASMKQIENKIDRSTYSSLEPLLTTLKAMSLNKSNWRVKISATTRGAGFLATRTYDLLYSLVPKAIQISGLTPVRLYRVTLALSQGQLHQAFSQTNCFSPQSATSFDDPTLPFDVISKLQSCLALPSPLAHFVDSFGKCDQGAGKYITCVPGTISKAKDIAVVTTGSKRKPTVDRVVTRPNPFVVTYKNLGEFVDSLSTPGLVSLSDRKFFCEYNPIPDVIWNYDDFLITNPGEITPTDSLQSDIQSVTSCMAQVRGRYPQLVRECRMDGNCDQSLFTTVDTSGLSMRLETSANESTRIVGMPTEFRVGSELIPDLGEIHLSSGLLTMIGEIPWGRQLRDGQWATDRSSRRFHCSMDAQWEALISFMMNPMN